jgi:two-component system, NarL family, response regulator NreC
MKIRIVIVDDHLIVRQGFKSLLNNHQDMEVVGEAADGRSAVKLVKELSPDIVLMDVSLPDLNGIEATRQIIEFNPGIKIIALSIHSDRRFIIEMFKAGASAYLLKDCAFEELITAIRSVMANQSYLCPKITDIILKDYLTMLPGQTRSAFELLSNREREVLQLMAEGLSTKEIAVRLMVSAKTIETHRRRMMERLKIDNLADLIKYALKEGMVSL